MENDNERRRTTHTHTHASERMHIDNGRAGSQSHKRSPCVVHGESALHFRNIRMFIHMHAELGRLCSMHAIAIWSMMIHTCKLICCGEIDSLSERDREKESCNTTYRENEVQFLCHPPSPPQYRTLNVVSAACVSVYMLWLRPVSVHVEWMDGWTIFDNRLYSNRNRKHNKRLNALCGTPENPLRAWCVVLLRCYVLPVLADRSLCLCLSVCVRAHGCAPLSLSLYCAPVYPYLCVCKVCARRFPPCLPILCIACSPACLPD